MCKSKHFFFAFPFSLQLCAGYQWDYGKPKKMVGNQGVSIHTRFRICCFMHATVFNLGFVFLGLATGSKYCSRRLIRTFIGECQTDTSKTIALKTHGRAHPQSESKYEKAILIIRNPYDAILAEFNRGESMNKTAIVDRSAFESKSE